MQKKKQTYWRKRTGTSPKCAKNAGKKQKKCKNKANTHRRNRNDTSANGANNAEKKQKKKQTFGPIIFAFRLLRPIIFAFSGPLFLLFFLHFPLVKTIIFAFRLLKPIIFAFSGPLFLHLFCIYFAFFAGKTIIFAFSEACLKPIIFAFAGPLFLHFFCIVFAFFLPRFFRPIFVAFSSPFFLHLFCIRFAFFIAFAFLDPFFSHFWTHCVLHLNRNLNYLANLIEVAVSPATSKAIDSAITRVALHCAEVRKLLKHQSLSVHDKRQGRQVAGVCGGAMVSLDLSRAFDQLPRWALQAALEHAQVDGPVIQAIIAVHERCSYTIRHGKHTDSIPMRKGVRQGCTLSPSLYAIFTIWVYDRLSSITSAEWASACVTLFADDSHLSWLVRSAEDLEFVCTCTRRTIELFQSVGMQINVSKSRIVLRVRGSRAKRWLRLHEQRTAQGPVVSVGTPQRPIHLPRARTMIYLGIVASYENFELQTCRHRLAIAMQTKHRLIKVLHSADLSLKHRLRLYVACVRSTMLYGQHAVGVTTSVLHRLDAADSRALRAISKSPSFLTRESTSALRRRLEAPSPTEALVKLLKGRIHNCKDVDSCRFFSAQLELLRPVSEPATASLIPRAVTVGVPCDICGTYFPDRRIMLSHRARKHPEACEPKTRMTASEYAGFTVDGMPQCVKCGCKFTRVEGLKKHLRKECRPGQPQEPSVSATSVVATTQGTTTGQVAQGPTARRESPRGRLTSVVPQASCSQDCLQLRLCHRCSIVLAGHPAQVPTRQERLEKLLGTSSDACVCPGRLAGSSGRGWQLSGPNGCYETQQLWHVAHVSPDASAECAV